MIMLSLILLVFISTLGSFSEGFSKRHEIDLHAFYQSLRSGAFILRNTVEPPINSDFYAVVMEVALKDEYYTLVAFHDGKSALYLSNGTITIGSNDSEITHELVSNILAATEGIENQFHSVSEYKFPEYGKVHFYLIGKDRVLKSEQFNMDELGSNESLLSSFFHQECELYGNIKFMTGNKESEPPLIYAGLVHDHLEVEALLESEADVTQLSSKGASIMRIAYYTKQLELFKLILDKGIDPDIQISTRYAGQSSDPMLLEIAGWENTNYLKAALAAGANINVSDEFGLTAIMLAAERGLTDSMKFLIDAGCNIEARDNLGVTPLMVAAYNGHLEAVTLLIQNGAEVKARDKENTTAIMCAAQFGFTKVVKALLKKGADPNFEGNHGYSALELAQAGKYKKTVRLMKSFK